MLQKRSNDSRINRSSGHTTSSRTPNRGGIHKQKPTTPRLDRDGDLIMGATPASRGGNGGGRGGRHSRRGQGDANNSRGPSPNMKAGVDPTKMLQQVLAQGFSTSHPSNKGPRNSFKPGRRGGRTHDPRESLDEISIIGLNDSVAAKNPGGGSSELITWLEQKATKAGPKGETVKIKKSRLEGPALIISVRPQDTPMITKLNDWQWAKAKLSIKLLSKAKALESPPADVGRSNEDTEDVVKTLRDFLYRRYNPENKLLDLSALGQDQELIKVGMFNVTSRESRFFQALMKVCDDTFTDAKAKEEAILSVSLANNTLNSISSVTALAQTFPFLRNLDLSNNQIKSLSALEAWRWKFRKLDHLVLSSNPIETELPSYKQDISKWFPTLTKINSDQIRSPGEVEASIKGKLPLPVLSASFRDENSISQDFVKYFFPMYDTDRSTLVNNFYDGNSQFSLSVNNHAPLALESMGQQVPGWDAYKRQSRNLKMLSQLPPKIHRLKTTTDTIRDTFMSLPPTVHPDLMAEPQKWCIECHTIPGLADLTGQSKSGVGGMIVYVHGEFTEVDGYTRQGTVKRSFDRTFVLGPGGPTGIRVTSDSLILRSYGGHDAWQPEGPPAGMPLPSQALYQVHIETPAGFAMPTFGKSEEQVMKERLILEMSQGTGLTLEASHECLALAGWNPEGAMQSFLGLKASLPREAFITTR